MQQGKSTKTTLIRIGIAIILTLIPIVVFKQVWPILVSYMPIITGVTSFVAGLFLIVMYIKGYSWQMVAWKIKSLFTEKEDMRKHLALRLDPATETYKSRSVIVAGIFLIIAGIYTMTKYEVKEVKQQKRGLINIKEENY